MNGVGDESVASIEMHGGWILSHIMSASGSKRMELRDPDGKLLMEGPSWLEYERVYSWVAGYRIGKLDGMAAARKSQ